MISVEAAGARDIDLTSGKSDSFVAKDFAWTCGGNPAISHVKVIASGNSEVHMVIFTLSMIFQLLQMRNTTTAMVFRRLLMKITDRLLREN
jgi:hypothetical protein